MSYCRITGKAPKAKPNYFPLLPPISPADARRFCRITGKAYGLPTHCYIPVILTAFSNKSKCRITNSEQPHHHYEPDYEYGRRKHIMLADYRYMLPVLDETNDKQRSLIEILNSKDVQCDENYFIYSIKEQKCNLVFPAHLEAAVRDGDVRDVMFAKTNDSVLLYMKKGKSVSLDLKDYENEKNLFEGEGPRCDVVIARQKEENSSYQNGSKRKKNGLQKIKTIDGSACVSKEITSITNDDHSQHTPSDEIKSSNQIDTDKSDCKEQKHSEAQNRDSLLNKNVDLNDAKLCESIPNQSEILKIMQNYTKGTVVHDSSKISSLSINIGTDEIPRNVLILGCIVNTADGDVFVAGRTVYTENGLSIFEPGIYVQSKNGPAFIPGQIVYTEEEGEERFCPGQIIDTEFGPRFVPGKICEVDGEVTFTPAQIVQTDQGPKFIASDLQDDENGERKYSVQSFLLFPEEMTLLKPMHIWTSHSTNGDQTIDIDMNMFNHLSEAGIIVGSQIEVMTDVDVNALFQKTINEQAIRKLAGYLGYNDAKQSTQIANFECIFEKIQIFINMVQKNPQYFFSITGNTINNNNNNNNNNNDDDENVIDFIKTSANTTNANTDLKLINIISKTVLDCVLYESEVDTLHDGQKFPFKNNLFSYEIISQCFIKNLKQYSEQFDSLKDLECFERIEKLLSSPEIASQIKNSVKMLAAQNIKVNKIDMIKAMINERTEENKTDILENIRIIMENDAIDELFESVHNLIYHEPSLKLQIITEMQKQTKNLTNENSVVEILRNCIVAAVQKTTSNDIKQINNSPGNDTTEKINIYLTDTISLARALGFTDCILNLSNIINSDGDVIEQLNKDEKSYELLQRVIVMHKLSKNDEIREKALELLRKDPYSSRNDINLRELLRLSGICTINLTKENTIKDSNDIPISLIYSGNQLAIQDFFMRTQSKPSGPILIVKDRFQAVVPRESSRDVLTGKCSYNVLDENGIRHFEPLHMFTALKLKNVTMFEDRYSSYSAQNNTNNKIEKKYDIDIDSILNMSAIATASSNGFITYKSTILPRKELDSLCITHRNSSHQVNYRRSFYL